jgi:hypothetical protein
MGMTPAADVAAESRRVLAEIKQGHLTDLFISYRGSRRLILQSPITLMGIKYDIVFTPCADLYKVTLHPCDNQTN